MCLGVPGRLVEQQEAQGGLLWGMVEFAGVRRRVCLSCVPEVGLGDYVLIHAGIALTVIDEAEAQRVFAALSEEEQGEALTMPENAGVP